MQAQTETYRGNTKTWSSITTYSENSFHNRRQGETINKKLSELEEGIKKQHAKREHLIN